MDEKVETWICEINFHSDIAVTEPQAEYSFFTAGYQQFEELIRHKLIPAFTEGHIVIDIERQLLSLPCLRE